MDITDVWKNAYSENSSKKIWAAKFVARHPNLVAIDLSSFKCGHDAPNYNTIENIIEASNTPYFTFFDIDESKPSGSIKIRVETIDYFLQRYQEHLQRKLNTETELQYMVETYRKGLLRANAKATDKLQISGRINISGNDSRKSGHKGLPSDGLMSHGHGHDEWVPVALELGSKAARHNGNGRHDSATDEPEQAHTVHSNGNGAKINSNVMDLSAPVSNGKPNEAHLDSSAYDAIRKSNTVDDPAEEEFGSGSASCSIPTKDYPLKAYAADGEAVVGLPDEEEDGSQLQFIQLGNFKIPRKTAVKEEMPVEAD